MSLKGAKLLSYLIKVISAMDKGAAAAAAPPPPPQC
jgi:hypothetical protein